MENRIITKYFEKADSSFPVASDEHVTDGDDDAFEEDDDIPLSILKLMISLDLVKLDQKVNTCDNNNNRLGSSSPTNPWKWGVIPTIADACCYLDKLKDFAQHQGNAYLLEHVMSSCNIVNNMAIPETKQKPITVSM